MLNPIKDDLRYKNISINWTTWNIVLQDGAPKKIKWISSIPLKKWEMTTFYTPTKITSWLEFFDYVDNEFKTCESLTTQVVDYYEFITNETPGTYSVNKYLWQIDCFSAKDTTIAFSYDFTNISILNILKNEADDLEKTFDYADKWTVDERIISIYYYSPLLKLEAQETIEYEWTPWNYRISKITTPIL